MSREPDVVPVVVVGAGPVGLTAATLLAQYGVRSLVLERHPTVYPLPRAVHLDDEVVRILQHLGIADDFATLSRPALGLRLLDDRHRVLAEFTHPQPPGSHGHPQANMFDQPDLERLLRANLDRYPQAQIRAGVEVIDVQPTGSGQSSLLRVSFRDPTTGRPGEVVARAVLGCDGARSRVRAQIGSHLEDLGFEERWLVIDADCPRDLDAWDGVHQICDRRRAATFMRIGDTRYRWEFRLGDTETPGELLQTGRLDDLLAPWLKDVPIRELTLLRTAEYTFRACLADRWREGRVFLLGDAAHLTPPFIGQGLASGLRDAYNLAWKLALVLQEGADDALLDTYQAERRPHTRSLIRLAVLLGQVMTGGPDGAATLRRSVLTALDRVPGKTSITTPRLTAGPLVRRGPRARRNPAGRLCPQPWVDLNDDDDDGDGGRHRLDDVLGPSFALLLDGPADPALTSTAHQLGARVLQLDPGADPAGTRVIHSPPLRAWMARYRCGGVLLRPDRVVLLAVGRPSTNRAVRRALTTRGAPPQWRRWLPPNRAQTPPPETTGPEKTGPEKTCPEKTGPERMEL